MTRSQEIVCLLCFILGVIFGGFLMYTPKSTKPVEVPPVMTLPQEGRETTPAQERRLKEAYDKDKKQYDEDQRDSTRHFDGDSRNPMRKSR